MSTSDPRSYADAHKLCTEHPRFPKRRLDGRETYLYGRGDEYIVSLFGKEIVFYRPDNSIHLDTCGWKTVTTKERMNRLMPRGWKLYSQSGQWWLVRPGPNWDWESAPKWAIDRSFTILPDDSVAGAISAEQVAEQHKLVKRVKAYAKAYAQALFAGNVRAPSGADCWFCHMVDTKTQEPWGGTDHLLSHLDEKYYVPSLLVNAMRAPTAKMSQMSLWQVNNIWTNGGPEESGINDYLLRQVKDTLEDYLLRQLELG